MAFIMAVLTQHRSKKQRGRVNQAAISPWLSNSQADSSVRQKQRKQETLSQCAAAGRDAGLEEKQINSTLKLHSRVQQFPSYLWSFLSSLCVFCLFVVFFFFWGERENRVEANLVEVSREKTSSDARCETQQDKHELLPAKQPLEMTVRALLGSLSGLLRLSCSSRADVPGHRTARCGTEATAMFSSWTARSNNLIYPNMYKQTAQR